MDSLVLIPREISEQKLWILIFIFNIRQSVRFTKELLISHLSYFVALMYFKEVDGLGRQDGKFF